MSRYFNRWMDFLYTTVWYGGQRRGELMTMPTEFRKHYQKCVVIIEPPSSLPACCEISYRNYSSRFNFISQGWGGLIKKSGLLEKLLPGNVIFADRGLQFSSQLDYIEPRPNCLLLQEERNN